MIRPISKPLTAPELIAERLALVAYLNELDPADPQDRAEIESLQEAIEAIEEELAR
jgi:hypothetical protein